MIMGTAYVKVQSILEGQLYITHCLGRLHQGRPYTHMAKERLHLIAARQALFLKTLQAQILPFPLDLGSWV
jgi:hypothetical protein